jgi:hypothetical protein
VTEAGLARGSVSAIGLGNVFVGAGEATQSETWRCSVIGQALSTVVLLPCSHLVRGLFVLLHFLKYERWLRFRTPQMQ